MKCALKINILKHILLQQKILISAVNLSILNEQFNPSKPNAVWCTNITYIWTIDGFVYLTSY
ncbi:hypothetical protein psyc5s11_31580 [Clostridium gelidum]|uniref:Transposase n=1 Tax=Clostridium gelidum TaxID=704125 RepID=A0ABN6IY55_9CLOT|nr:hypothetical protein psyc5s11_31580 [Clostridium gelidum]